MSHQSFAVLLSAALITPPTLLTTYTYSALTGQGGRIACQGQVENQLIRIDLPDGRIATYRYDGLGRRIEKTVNGTLQRFLYDQEDIVALFSGPANCQTHVFLHGPGIDQPLALTAGDLTMTPLSSTALFGCQGRAFLRDTNADCNPFVDAVGFREPIVYLQTDGLGSPTSLVSETGGFFRSLFLAERYTYDSFGTPTITAPDGTPRATSAFGNPYLFTGREFDAESGLYYYRARYYDPHTGRFLQEDPLNGDDVHPQQLYLYAEGNPVNLVDPGGQTAFAPAVGIGAVCVTSVAGALICAAGAVALVFAVLQATKAAKGLVAKGTICPISKSGSSKNFPANPDDWVPPDGVKEEPKTAQETGGAKRHWKDKSGETVREWHKGEPGKPGWRGKDHWHDETGRHIDP